MQKKCSVIILAAGYSTRMGNHKFALALPDGTSFLENIIMQYADFGCDEIIVVINKDGKNYLDEYPLRIATDIALVLNEHPEYERFYSLRRGLSIVKHNHPVFIHNADNPYASDAVLEALYVHREKVDIVKPVYEKKGGHPILISPEIVEDILSTKNHDICINEFLKSYSCKEIESMDENILLNINRMSDYEKHLSDPK